MDGVLIFTKCIASDGRGTHIYQSIPSESVRLSGRQPLALGHNSFLIDEELGVEKD